MKINFVKISVLLAFLYCKTVFAESGLFFNINASSNQLNITTTIPNHFYPNAGIKIDTPGYTLTGCRPAANGYCLFSVSDSTPALLSVNGSATSVSAILCLNGLGPLSCQHYTVPTVIFSGIAYVTNTNNNTVSICPVSADGSFFGTCTTSSGNSTFDHPVAIALPLPGATAYIANFNANTLSICPINSNGSFGTCNTSNGNGTFDHPDGVALDPTNSYVYVTNQNNNTLSICSINNDGSLGTCTVSNGNGTFSSPTAVNVQLSSDASATYAYIANANSTVSICPVNTGSLGTCITSNGNGTFSLPQGIGVNAAGNFAYIGNFGANTVSICVINSDGSLGTCTITSGNGTFNFSANQAIGLFMSSLTSYGYTPNDGNNTVSICPINNNGSLGACVITNGNGTFNQPSSIVVMSLFLHAHLSKPIVNRP